MKLMALLLVLFVVACSNTPGGGIYRTTIQQGNIITPKMVGQLEIGMTKAQASFILGQPILQTFYNNDRWDYLYRLRPPLQPEVARTLTLYFAEDKLASFVTDVVVRQSNEAEKDAKSAAGAIEGSSESVDGT